jgi:hypothetical protein
MEMVVQPCLTACASASYDLCNCVLRFIETVTSSSPIYGTGCATVSYKMGNSVLLLTELRLTAYGNGWQAVLPIYGKGFRSGTSENQRLHKKLGNSENRVTYRFR